MRRYRIFVESNLIDLDLRIVKLDQNSLRYIEGILRGALDSQIIVFDGSGNEYLTAFDDQRKVLVIQDTILNCFDKGFSLSVFQAIPKSNYMEYVNSLCSQLGVNDIFPTITSRTVVRGVGSTRLDRWKRIALESCKVGGYCNTTSVHDIVDFGEMLSMFTSFDLVLFMYENATKRLREYEDVIMRASNIALLVGPEGGFDPEEAHELEKHGLSLSLGPVIYRSRWAASAAVASINYIKGILG
jgi:16S rRNA (uracil1498-N3)-methyltransferase